MKKQGFTLVELLAVIVILAIVLAITVPGVSGIINNTAEQSFKTDVSNVAQAIRYKIAQESNFDPTSINETNINDQLEMSSDNYKSIRITNTNGVIVLTVVGQKKWEGLTAVVTDGKASIADARGQESTTESCFTFDSSTKTITKYNYASCSTNVVIPNTIGGVAVEHIGRAAFNNPIGQQCIEASGMSHMMDLTYIHTEGDGYSGCGYLYDDNAIFPVTNVVLPAYLKTIDQDAFTLNQLTSIIIPTKVTEVGDEAFAGNLLSSVILPSGLTYIGLSAFAGNQLPSVTIPNSVTDIAEMAFANNLLNNVTLSNQLSTISSAAFASNQLTSVTIPNSVTVIEPSAFQGNILTNVTLPSNLMAIGSGAFYDNQLTSISIPNSVISIDMVAFNKNSLPDNQAFIYARNNDGTNNTSTIVSYGGAKKSGITIPSTVTIIGPDAFFDTGLTGSLTLPSTVTTIGDSAFRYNQISSLVMANTITSMGNYAFDDNAISSLTISSGLTSIGWHAFCTNQLTSVVIPSTVTSINGYAFQYNQLTSITIPSSVTSISTGAFLHNNFTSITIQGSDPKRFNSKWTAIGFPANLMPA